MDDAPRCSVCGSSLIAGGCLSCDRRRWSRFVHREVVGLTVLIGVTVMAYFATRAVAHSNEALHRRQAAAWFEAAQRAAQDANAETAVGGLRQAVSKDPGNRRYRLALADVLAVSRFDNEAKRVLLGLRETQPEDPQTNLQLARLEARGSDPSAARRYYQNAVAGMWRPEQADDRRRARTELIEFLLAQRELGRALSELLVLAANLPPDAAVHARVGQMFLAAADPSRALDHFVEAVRLSPKNAGALAGAGEAAFALGDYSRARQYLTALPADDAHAADLREVVELVLSADPMAPRLGAGERLRRLRMALEQAVQRLETCSGATSAEASAGLESVRGQAREFQAALELRQRRDTRNVVDDGVDLVYRIERAVDQRCAVPPTAFDRALLLIGRRHGFGEL